MSEHTGEREIKESFSMWEIIREFSGILYKLDVDHWVGVCGSDAYIYLLYQRKMIKMLFIFGIISLFVSLPVNLLGDWPEPVLERITIYNKNLSWETTWIHVILILIFTFGVFKTVRNVKREIRKSKIREHYKISQHRDSEWLKQRTVHIRGVLPEDRKGEKLRQVLNDYCQKIGGSVLSVHVIQDYEKLMNLELKRGELVMQKRHFEDKSQRGCCSCCIPGVFIKDEKHRKQLEIIDTQIEEVILKPTMSSGHAFVAFDSLYTMQRCIEHFRMGARGAITLVYQSLKSKSKETCCPVRRRATSTFGKLILREAQDPDDILWKNIGGTRGLYLYRRIFLNFGALVVLIFFSTPTVLYYALTPSQLLSLFDLEQDEETSQQKENWLYILKSYLPPLIILGFNLILILLIDYAAYLERQITHSKCQAAILYKAAFYLTLNMFVFPGLALATANSLFEILKTHNWNITFLLGDIYLADSGAFFVNLLLQQAFFTAIFYLLRGNEIGTSWGSLSLAIHKKEEYYVKEPWRRNEIDVFQYGYFYAQMLTAFLIALSFSSTIPLVIPAGAFFFIMRHIVDGYNLLIVHKREIQSSLEMIRKILIMTCCCALFYQIGMLGFFVSKKKYTAAWVVFAIFWVSFFITLSLSDSIFDKTKARHEILNFQEASDFQSYIQNFKTVQESLQKGASEEWRRLYSHPLKIQHSNTDSEDETPRDAYSRRQSQFGVSHA
eukprot:CAMPEP_0115016764 /NCGR_PEP_ID=MMETSP0216-20121206/27668_1 /TAXON_ID=223996 /ORGANISM="Protocruzia adherens, Strain Boccale" /LENGTH=723 /DNA_ID=CAMNT_0002387357 /DNA_START=291 /DNA_END=2462 /DNA_ORIENTATION=-